MWHRDVVVESAYTDHSTQWVWAKIAGLGWRRIKDGAPDGCTNMFIIMSTAHASGKHVDVDIDGDDLINTAYLL